jgi:three-Cys-motif partner protein
MAKDKRQSELFSEEELALFVREDSEPATKVGDRPLWTEKKAQFIMLYLRYFVYITKHGTYIDGFAGPQEECETDAWAAKLVLDSKPQWLRNFHLCDANPEQVKRLRDLVDAQPRKDEAGRLLNRTISLYQGDFNKKIDEILDTAHISEKEATFCLLDQRTFECDWESMGRVARHKSRGNKIELFYFLANSWLDRALSAIKDTEKLARWWGRDDWKNLKSMSRGQRRDAIVRRLKDEFGYKSVKPYPIYERKDGGAVMYYMIHATDHPEAPVQMSRAYRAAVRPDDPYEGAQEDFDFASEVKDPESQLGLARALSA